MSTINKIDKVHRLAKVLRRDTVRALQRTIPMIPTITGRLLAAATVVQLEEIRRNPREPGHVKSERFATIINNLTHHPAEAA
jgi:hypothetical protein